ncbi:MAG: hypothetical protein LBQ60_04330 [Bacteroidales bacterium]|jgi:hypothetical protein|nr:hypothetical protein [Bacteroidales bacterium]
MRAGHTYSLKKQAMSLVMLFLLLTYSVTAQLLADDFNEISDNHPATVSLLDNLILTRYCQIPSVKSELGNHRSVMVSLLCFGSISLNTSKPLSDLLQFSTEQPSFRLIAIPTYLFIRILRI